MSSGLLSSAQRPVPLQARADLKIKRISYQQAGSWVIKDPVALRYFRFQPEQYKILELLDGKRNLEEIRDEFHKEFPAANLSLEEIQSLISDLHKSGLVYSSRFGQGVALIKEKREQRRKKIWGALRNVLYIRTPGWDPERALQFIHPFFKWMFTPFGVAVWCAVVFSSWILLGVQFKEFQGRLPEFQQFFGWPNLLYLWLILGGAKIIHEFGHGLSCKHYGGECHEMGLMFLVFSPCLYCDVSDSWMLSNKWKRIMIGAAGMYIEVMLASIAIFAWWYTNPGLLHHLCLNLFFVSTITTVIFNANPLMRYDGYYMMSDWLEIPNLRPKADKLLREAFSWYCLGIETRPDPFMPQTGKEWFVLFSIAATIYRWFILAVITVFFYSFLKPYDLQSIGIAMAVSSIVGIVISLSVTVYKIISAPRRDPLSTTKITVSLFILAAAATAALTIPFPWSLEAALVLEPHKVQHVYVITPGRLVKFEVEPGEHVQQGQVLARLKNFEKEQEYERLIKEENVAEQEKKTFRALEEYSRRKLVEDKLETIKKQKADLEDQLSKLTIVAPATGKVITAPRVNEKKHDPDHARLEQWHGTPLNPRNEGCWLEQRTHLLSIAPDDKFQAVLVIDQADRNDIRLGQVVRVKLDDLPDMTYPGTISELSQAHLEYAPVELSNKAEGGLPTTTDDSGREKLQSIAYQATVLLEEDTPLLKSGLRGRARFQVANRSLWQWGVRYWKQTFHFRL